MKKLPEEYVYTNKIKGKLRWGGKAVPSHDLNLKFNKNQLEKLEKKGLIKKRKTKEKE